MKLNNLKPAKGSVKSKKRIARGVGSGKGRTATRGHKGAKSRSGYSNKREFQGGQMPLQKLLPKRGFKNTHRRYKSTHPGEYVVFNLNDISHYVAKYGMKEFSYETLYSNRIIQKGDKVKVLAYGKIETAVEVFAHRFSDNAKKSIAEAGGKCYHVISSDQLQGLALGNKLETVTQEDLYKHVEYLNEGDMIAVMAKGEVRNKLNIHAHFVSEDAKSMIESQGGTVTQL